MVYLSTYLDICLVLEITSCMIGFHEYAGSAARPLYYSNRNGSSRFPFGIYSDDVSINVFGNMIGF